MDRRVIDIFHPASNIQGFLVSVIFQKPVISQSSHSYIVKQSKSSPHSLYKFGPVNDGNLHQSKHFVSRVGQYTLNFVRENICINKKWSVS